MKTFKFAINGIKTAFSSEKNLKTHLAIALLVLIAGWYLELSMMEWMLLIFCIGTVISMELLNTAIEYFVDFYSPEIHPQAGKIKDIAAGAVLVVALMSVAIGLIIFIPKIAALI